MQNIDSKRSFNNLQETEIEKQRFNNHKQFIIFDRYKAIKHMSTELKKQNADELKLSK